jgi:hypothetical protein
MAKSTTDSRPRVSPHGLDLRAAYLLLWPVYVPDLLAQAHRVHPIAAESEWDNPAEADRFALDLAWAGEPTLLAKPGMPPIGSAAVVAAMAIAANMLDVDAQARRLEAMVQRVLCGISDDVEAGDLRLVGVHGHYRRSFEPDPSVIRNLRLADRLDNRAAADGWPITHLRVLPSESEALERLAQELPDEPRQPPFTLVDQQRSAAPPRPTKKEWLIATLSKRAVPRSVNGWHDFALEGMAATGNTEPRHRDTLYAKGFSPRMLQVDTARLRAEGKVPYL